MNFRTVLDIRLEKQLMTAGAVFILNGKNMVTCLS